MGDGEGGLGGEGPKVVVVGWKWGGSGVVVGRWCGGGGVVVGW